MSRYVNLAMGDDLNARGSFTHPAGQAGGRIYRPLWRAHVSVMNVSLGGCEFPATSPRKQQHRATPKPRSIACSSGLWCVWHPVSLHPIMFIYRTLKNIGRQHPKIAKLSELERSCMDRTCLFWIKGVGRQVRMSAELFCGKLPIRG